MSKTKLHKTYNLGLKLVILVLAYWAIYKQVFVNKNWTEIVSFFSEQYTLQTLVFPITGIILMMPLNWGVESIKWQYLIRKNEKISFFISLKGVFSGVTISSMTPNRIGEYFGRVFILKKTHPVRGILMTIVGSISQLLVTVTVGGLALIFSLIRYPSLLNIDSLIIQILAIFSVLIILLVLAGVYFNIRIISNIISWITRKWPKIRKFANVFSYYNRIDLLKVFLYSFLRYLIFSLQFYFLLLVFHINVNLFEGYLIISLIFLGITVIPSVALAELGIRGSVALFVIENYFKARQMNPIDGYELNIMAVSSILWLINIVLPAVIGSIFIINLSFFKNHKNGS